MTFFCRIADLDVRFDTRYEKAKLYAADYLIPETAQPDLTLSASDEELDEVLADIPARTDAADARAYAEFIALLRAFSREAYAYDVFLLHAAVIEADGMGYAFFAPSGTGKSTHIRLWRTRFGKAVNIVNGDKPFIRRKGDAFYAYGTPWCGKERWQRNVCVPLGGICELARGVTDVCTRLSVSEATPILLSQTYLPDTPEGAGHVLELLDGVMRQVPVFHLSCTKNPLAAEVACRALLGKLL